MGPAPGDSWESDSLLYHKINQGDVRLLDNFQPYQGRTCVCALIRADTWVRPYKKIVV